MARAQKMLASAESQAKKEFTFGNEPLDRYMCLCLGRDQARTCFCQGLGAHPLKSLACALRTKFKNFEKPALSQRVLRLRHFSALSARTNSPGEKRQSHPYSQNAGPYPHKNVLLNFKERYLANVCGLDLRSANFPVMC